MKTTYSIFDENGNKQTVTKDKALKHIKGGKEIERKRNSKRLSKR